MIGDVAYAFHFPPSELEQMDFDSEFPGLMFFHAQALRIAKQQK